MIASGLNAPLHLRTFVATILGLFFSVGAVAADELIYIYGPDCGACQKWQSEVGPIYTKTFESSLLPMVRITLDDWRTQDHDYRHCAVAAVVGTPTFIQLHGCREVDRITGYSNDELFWLALGRMANTARSRP